MKTSEKTAFEIILVIAVVLAVVMLPLAAKAGSGGMHQPPAFTEFDLDGDGFVTEEECTAFRARRMTAMAEAGKPMKGAKTAPDFADADTDGDGKLTEDELTTAQVAHRQAMRAAHQSHGMGKGKGMKMPSFEEIDTDGDGCIDAEEFAAHQASHHKQRSP